MTYESKWELVKERYNSENNRAKRQESNDLLTFHIKRIKSSLKDLNANKPQAPIEVLKSDIHVSCNEAMKIMDDEGWDE